MANIVTYSQVILLSCYILAITKDRIIIRTVELTAGYIYF